MAFIDRTNGITKMPLCVTGMLSHYGNKRVYRHSKHSNSQRVLFSRGNLSLNWHIGMGRRHPGASLMSSQPQWSIPQPGVRLPMFHCLEAAVLGQGTNLHLSQFALCGKGIMIEPTPQGCCEGQRGLDQASAKTRTQHIDSSMKGFSKAIAAACWLY